MPYNETVATLGLEQYKYHFITQVEPLFKAQKGLSEEVVRQIRHEPGEVCAAEHSR